MLKVIETNLSMDGEIIKDHQSRVIEVESWEVYVKEVQNKETNIRSAILGHLSGCTIPRCSKVENLIYDEKHLSCDIYNYAGVKTRKLAYLI